MPRTIPAAPFTGLDPTLYVPYGVVIGHDTGKPEAHWRPIVRWLNGALSSGHAGTVVSMSWADGQAESDDVDWAAKITIDVPPAPSSSHRRLVVSMWLEPSDGLIRVRDSVVGGAFSVIVPPAPADPDAELREVELLDADPSAVLELDAIGEIHARSLECRWLPIDGLDDDWPEADDELPAAAVGDVDPIDDHDVRPDDFGHSHTFVACAEALGSVRNREAGRLTAAGWGAPLARRPLRTVVPAPQGGSTITLKLRLEHAPDEESGAVWVQHGRGGTGTVIAGRALPYVHEEVVDGGTMLTTRTVTVDIDDEIRVTGFDPNYPGVAHLAVFPERVNLYAVSAWSR